MPRHARIVIPEVPYHIIQRGNRRQPVFFEDEDRDFYLKLLHKWGNIEKLSVLGYCLMTNHIHCVAVPHLPTSLARTFAAVHKRYSQVINKRYGWKGYLWQGRFLSYPMDELYRYRGLRYTELNPVRAGLVDDAIDYRWSSARAHVLGEENPLLGPNPLGMTGAEWRKYLAEGNKEAEFEIFRRCIRSGRPLGNEDFVKRIMEK